ncbi:hypothetical protein F5Y10DRAFT_283456 [Nemania abortiva]|nr:hypothetical protein F5Y10DRAFT_283456 [Nemania abortiva]
MTTFESRMSFLQPWALEKGNPYVRGAAAEGFPRLNYSSQEHSVGITDGRPTKNEFDINVHGFAYHTDNTITDEILEILRKNDKALIARDYYPLVEALVKKNTGASRVVIFDHTLRRRDPTLASGDNLNWRDQPASLVTGALRRVYQHLGDEADELLQGRAQIINVWRPLRGPVQEWPLATMDSRSLTEPNIHPTNIFKYQYELQGQTVSITHSPDQRWYYLDQQQTNEVTFIKIWDNQDDAIAKLCAHCAFPHPETPPDAPVRESMEVRCLIHTVKWYSTRNKLSQTGITLETLDAKEIGSLFPLDMGFIY